MPGCSLELNVMQQVRGESDCYRADSVVMHTPADILWREFASQRVCLQATVHRDGSLCALDVRATRSQRRQLQPQHPLGTAFYEVYKERFPATECRLLSFVGERWHSRRIIRLRTISWEARNCVDSPVWGWWTQESNPRARNSTSPRLVTLMNKTHWLPAAFILNATR